MIPTRLGAKYNGGTVVGFNSRTGSILVLANSAVFVNRCFPGDFLQVSADSLKSFPEGYQWPTVHDFYSLGFNDDWTLETPKCKYVFNVVGQLAILPNASSQVFLTSSTDAESFNECLQYRYQVVKTSNTLYARLSLYGAAYSDGYLIPVYYINGDNCDSN